MKTREPISTTHKDLVEKEWDFEKNNSTGLSPNTVVSGSSKKAWWICSKNPEHRWSSEIRSKLQKNKGCPYCAHRIISIENSIYSTFPDLMKEWDFVKNTQSPKETFPHSREKVWWVCSKNPEHKWDMTPAERSSGRGCSYCAGKRVDRTNNFEVMNPELMKEWDFEENSKENVLPDKITSGRAVQASWICSKNPEHKWKAMVCNRTQKQPTGCPYCSGRNVNTTNSLLTLFPSLSREWDYKENEITPDRVSVSSACKVWWICSKNPEHKWKSSVSNRTNPHLTTGCPFCPNVISKGHQELINIIKKYCLINHKISVNDRTMITNPETKRRLELDVYLPDLKVAFEFNGEYYHNDEVKPHSSERHQMKTQLCEEKGIKLIHIDEKDWNKNMNTYEDMIKTLVKQTEWDDFLSENELPSPSVLLYPKEMWRNERNKHIMTENQRNFSSSDYNSSRLLHFFHDEWEKKREIVKSMILHRRGKTRIKINARECQVVSVNRDVARTFFEESHISGFVPSQKFFALVKDEEIFSMLALRKPIQKKYGNVCEISRFASKTNTLVMGGFGKLFKQAEEWSRENQYVGILCYADLRFGDGKTYEKCGFSLKGRTSPGYYYVNPITGERKFRFKYRANKSLNMTEKEVATLNGVFRAYDLGHNIYLYSH